MRIAMSRGDIKWQRFKILTPEEEVSTLDFTNIYFTVKRKPTDKTYLFQKSYKRGEIYKLDVGEYQFKIDVDDTKNLAVGEYVFDVQISYKNLLKETFVGLFVVKNEVTHPENEEGQEEEEQIIPPVVPDDPPTILVIPDYTELVLETPTPVTVDGEIGDYNSLHNLPKLNDVTLKGSLSLDDIGAQPAGTYASEALTPEELDEILV